MDHVILDFYILLKLKVKIVLVIEIAISILLLSEVIEFRTNKTLRVVFLKRRYTDVLRRNNFVFRDTDIRIFHFNRSYETRTERITRKINRLFKEHTDKPLCLIVIRYCLRNNIDLGIFGEFNYR